MCACGQYISAVWVQSHAVVRINHANITAHCFSSPPPQHDIQPQGFIQHQLSPHMIASHVWNRACASRSCLLQISTVEAGSSSIWPLHHVRKVHSPEAHCGDSTCVTACNGRETARRCCHSFRRCSAIQAVQRGRFADTKAMLYRGEVHQQPRQVQLIHLHGFCLTLLRHMSPTPGFLAKECLLLLPGAGMHQALFGRLCVLFVSLNTSLTAPHRVWVPQGYPSVSSVGQICPRAGPSPLALPSLPVRQFFQAATWFNV